LGYENFFTGQTVSTISSNYYLMMHTQIPCHHSNFVWASFKLIVEMQESCYWFWIAAKDANGMAMCDVAMRNKSTHGTLYNAVGARDAAQSTQVMTLPHAVVQSLIRYLNM
jgi:hypothetical protein